MDLQRIMLGPKLSPKRLHQVWSPLYNSCNYWNEGQISGYQELKKDERGEWKGREYSVEGNVREMGVPVKGQNEESYDENVLCLCINVNMLVMMLD